MNGDSEPSKFSRAEDKRIRRKSQRTAERSAGRDLDALAEKAVVEAMRLAPEVAAAPDRASSERLVDVPLKTVDSARFVRKRINESLAVGEWLDAVQAWVWQRSTHTRLPLGEGGREFGIEIRLEQPPQSD